MYLNESAILETLKLVTDLPQGSQIAFDYFTRAIVNGEPPYDS